MPRVIPPVHPPAAPSRLLGRLLAPLGLLALLALLALPGAVLAHAGLTGSDPPDGAVLARLPQTVTLRFDAPVRPLVARLTGPDGATRLLPGPAVAGGEVAWTLPASGAEGSHLLSWRVTAEDGHPIAGGLVLSVGRASALSSRAEETPRATQAGLWAARAVLVGSVLMAVGGAAFAAHAGVAASRRPAVLGLAALPAAIGFQGLDLLGLGPGSLGDAAVWAAAAEGNPGAAFSLTGLALLLALGRGALAAGAAVLAAGLAAATAGHAATADPQALMRPAVALHVIAAALWVGALAPLAASLKGGGALHRFSRAAPWVIALLLLTGSLLAVVQVERPAALAATAYGRVLLAKLALVAAMLALAAANRFRLAGRAETTALRRSIRAEIALSLLVIATLALWRFTPPPRGLPPPAGEVAQTFAAGALSARLVLGPARPGPVEVRLEDPRLDGRPFRPQAAMVEFSKPAYGLGPFRQQLAPGAAGGWAPARFVLPIDGFWVVRVQIRIDDFRAEDLRDIVEIPPASRGED